jgi:hypothetical protein
MFELSMMCAWEKGGGNRLFRFCFYLKAELKTINNVDTIA